MIIADFREKELRGKKMVFLAITPSQRHYAWTTGRAYPTAEEARHSLRFTPEGYIVKLHRRTVQRIRKWNAYRQGTAMNRLFWRQQY